MMGPHNYLSPESPMWLEIFDDMSASIDLDGVDMDGVDLLDAILPTQASFDLSPFLFSAPESVNVPPFEEILARTTFARTTLGCFTEIPLNTNAQEIGPSNPLGAALVESFMIPGPSLLVDSPTSTGAHTSLATSPLEQKSPWTTPGSLQASSPVAPIEGHYMFCPRPELYRNGPELAPRWPPGQVDEITAAFLSLTEPLAFPPYFNGQDQAWMHGILPPLGPLGTDTSLTGTSTALTTFYTPQVPLPTKNTIVGGKQSRQRLTKAGRITK